MASNMPNKQKPKHYEFRVDRHLDDHWVEWFEHLEITREIDGTTSLRGPVADQAALHSLLTKIRDLGMVLIAVRIISPPAEPGKEPPGAKSGPKQLASCPQPQTLRKP
ncbi:hypothetical protein [Arthrobacter sp. Z4-13]